jgi:hypothetical protein
MSGRGKGDAHTGWVVLGGVVRWIPEHLAFQAARRVKLVGVAERTDIAIGKVGAQIPGQGFGKLAPGADALRERAAPGGGNGELRRAEVVDPQRVGGLLGVGRGGCTARRWRRVPPHPGALRGARGTRNGRAGLPYASGSEALAECRCSLPNAPGPRCIGHAPTIVPSRLVTASAPKTLTRQQRLVTTCWWTQARHPGLAGVL